MSATTETRERPILFSGAMVRAILDNRKSQTRRVVKGTALDWLAPGMFAPSFVALPENGLSPYGYAGDRLWVRESFGYQTIGGGIADLDPAEQVIRYRADGDKKQKRD